MRLWFGVAVSLLAACGGELAPTTSDGTDDQAKRDFGTKKQHYRNDDASTSFSSGRTFVPNYCGSVSCDVSADGWSCNTVGTQRELVCTFANGSPTAACNCIGWHEPDGGSGTFEVDATESPDQSSLLAAWRVRCGGRCVDADGGLDAGE